MSGRRITIVASEVLGRAGTGGAGTADSLLAVALARHGHRVRLLIATGREIGRLDPFWTDMYAAAGIEIRILEHLEGVTPAYLRPSLEVFHSLREETPDVAVVNDWRGLGYIAQRARDAGLALRDTAFVLHCHGPARVLAEFARKVPDTLARFGEEVMERASLGMADAVVSPSAWLLGWMRSHGWPVPESARVIPYVRQSIALSEPPPPAPPVLPIKRLAFFGQLREGKGVRIYLEALAELDPASLDGVELLFLGRESERWTNAIITNSLPEGVRNAVAAVRFETGLERTSALAELRRPGTLAVMPSLLDNAPNTVAECIEQGISFVSTQTGGIQELVAEDDRDRVLCKPTAEDLAAALRVALSSPHGFQPATPARDPAQSLEAWLELMEVVAPRARTRAHAATRVSVVSADEESARRVAKGARGVEVEVVPATARKDGLTRGSAEWVVFLDRDDDPDDALVDRLVQAQAASGADVVTCAVRPVDDPGGIQLFLGDPGSLGLVENQYGVVGLVRCSLLTNSATLDNGIDADWVLFARLALGGATIVSIPEPLSSHSGTVGKVGDVPGDGLFVLRLFEQAAEAQPTDLPRLAATLAAASARQYPRTLADDSRPRRIVERSLVVVRAEGFGGLARRVGRRLTSILGSSWT